MRTRILLVLFLLGCISCKEEVKIVVPEVKLMVSPTGENSALPYLFSNQEKTLLSWVEKLNDSLTVLKYAELQNGIWQAPKEITRGTDWFVNWADFPAIAESNGNLISHVLKKSSAETYSYDVKMNLLQEGSKDWNTDLALHTDATPTEHGFVTVLPFKDRFFVTWLDGRNTEEKEGRERGAMTIRAAEVSPEGKINNEKELDARTCDCCQTTAAITANGPVVVYRDRFKDETRDISIVRQVAGEWTVPKPIYQDNWKIKGCPVNGPKAAVLENTLAVAWFTAAENQPTVKLIFSEDSGETFDNPITISSMNAMGRVDVLLVNDETAWVSFMESTDGLGKLNVMQVNRSGEMSEPILITELDASRKTGFPQMELVGDTIYLAWTDYSAEKTSIKTAFFSIDMF